MVPSLSFTTGRAPWAGMRGPFPGVESLKVEGLKVEGRRSKVGEVPEN
jgi:hypothetical protein